MNKPTNYTTSLLFLIACLCISVQAQEKEINSIDIAKYFQTSFDLESKERYKDAMVVLHPIIKNFPKGYTINYRIGWLHYLQGQYANAMKRYQKSLDIYPNSVEVLNAISLLYTQKANWEDLEKNARRTVTVDYYNYYANLYLANSFYQQGKYQQSLKITGKLLLIHPSSSDFLFTEGRTHLALKQYQEAQYDLESTQILNPYHTGAIQALKELSNYANKGQ